jgi:acetylornithine/N-succinyldiaminopimelate aminotransferase
LLILDEVQVGMGRSGKLWGYENLGIEPDIFTSAKGLGGGIPIGAVLCKSSCDVFEPGDHASTYGGNPFVCGVALAVCQHVEASNLIENVKERGTQLTHGLEKLATQYPHLIELSRGWGLIQGLVLRSDISMGAIDLVKSAMDSGLLLVPAGPTVVRFVPPLLVTAEEIDEALSVLDRLFAAL